MATIPPAAPTALVHAAATNNTAAFNTSLLQALGDQVTAGAMSVLESVEHYEGQNTRNNPLNVVQQEPGSSTFNSAGVQAYPTAAEGIQGTVDLFENNSVWQGVLAALKGGNAQQGISAFDSVYDRWAPGTNIPLLQGTAAQAVGARNIGAPGSSGTGAVDAVSIGNPLNIPGDIAGDAGGAVASGVESVINTFLRPALNFVEDSALVVFGFIALLVGVILLAHAGSSSSSKGSSGGSGFGSAFGGAAGAKAGSSKSSSSSTSSKGSSEPTPVKVTVVDRSPGSSTRRPASVRTANPTKALEGGGGDAEAAAALA